jgi:hypothetical protein
MCRPPHAGRSGLHPLHHPSHPSPPQLPLPLPHALTCCLPQVLIGYSIKGKAVWEYAHRLVAMAKEGRSPLRHEVVLHDGPGCRGGAKRLRSCCRVSHMRIGSRSDNMAHVTARRHARKARAVHAAEVAVASTRRRTPCQAPSTPCGSCGVRVASSGRALVTPRKLEFD